MTSPSAPTPIMHGEFSLYETPNGGLHLSYRPDGADEDKHIDIPPMMLKAAKMMGEGKVKLPGLGG
jgi:hypothetical protein